MKDPPLKKGTTFLQSTLPISPKVYNYAIHFQLLKRGQPPYKGQNGWSQSVLYSEVPLYLINYTQSFSILYSMDTIDNYCLYFTIKHVIRAIVLFKKYPISIS